MVVMVAIFSALVSSVAFEDSVRQSIERREGLREDINQLGGMQKLWIEMKNSDWLGCLYVK